MKYYPSDYVFPSFTGKFETKFAVLDTDTFGAAALYPNSCCLNFASPSEPGGGYLSVMDLKCPIRTQEEDLFRRSNLPSLMDIPEVRSHYPLKEVDGFYVSGVDVEKDRCLEVVFPFQTSVVTVPAVINPQTNDLVKRKIRRILDICAENGHTNIVLGAWGCGVFGNDPRFISSRFMRVVKEYFVGFFENVVFAIPNKESENHMIFKEVVETFVIL